jgi:hypothetical protein
MPSVFLDRAAPPTDAALAAALGRGQAHWTRLRDALAAAFPPLEAKWSYSGKAYGWSLQLKQKKRAVVYLVPGQGAFTASFAFGEKACQAAQRSDLPPAVLATIADAPKYVEGRGVRIDVRAAKDVAIVERLAALKMAN